MSDPLLIRLLTEAMSLQARGNVGAALLAYRRVQKQFPDCPDAWANASTLLYGMERFDEALASAERAVALDGANQPAAYALGSALHKLERTDEAEAVFRNLLEANPSHFEALVALAGINGAKNRFAESLELYNRAVALEPSNAHLMLRRGIIRMWALDLPGAEADVRAAMDMGFNEKFAWSVLTRPLLLMGRYREAWPYFTKSGMKLGTLFDNYNTGNPRWDGGPMQGRTLMVRTHHHGFGDVMQMSRFMPQIKEMSRARVLLSVYEPILRLMRGVPGVDGLIVQERDKPPFDAVINLLELPYALDIDSAALPPPVTFSLPDDGGPMPELDRPGFKVGLVWGGNPIHSMDEQRSMGPRPLDALADMQGAERVAWYGLQKPPSDAPPRLPGFIDMSPRMGDFMDTAQIVRRLDLVVSVDTSTLHLAGSLRVPTIAMIQYLPEWRWCLGEATPWYPTVKLLRQHTNGDWGGAVETLKQEIARRMADS